MISFNHLNKLFPDDPSIANDLINVFISEYPQFLEQINEALRNKNQTQLAFIGHKWKYSAKVLGMEPLTSHFRELENCEELSQEETKALSLVLLEMMNGVFQELKNYEAA